MALENPFVGWHSIIALGSSLDWKCEMLLEDNYKGRLSVGLG